MINDVNSKEMAVCLQEELRLDMDELPGLDIALIREIARVYKKKSVTAFYKWLLIN